MKTVSLTTHSPDETRKLGERVAKKLKPGDIICLFGDLGSGKTTFVKGIARGLGIDPEKITSPTFVIMNAYDGKLPVYHFDFYRLEQEAEISGIGYDDFLYGQGVALIEWAERFGSLLPKEHLAVKLQYKNEESRDFKLSAKNERYQKLISGIK